MNEITATATTARGAVTVRVHPGGALSELTLAAPAFGLGPSGLAAAILDAVRQATALANQRTKHALDAVLAGLGDPDRVILGLDQDAALTERAEATTPQSWRSA
jgi:YbaB/EbfC DNA-binding family protein